MKTLLFFFLFFCLSISGVARGAAALFQNEFFTLSLDTSLTCSKSNDALLSSDEIKNILAAYESEIPGLRTKAVKFLTLDHATDPKILQKYQGVQNQCQSAQPDNRDICIYEKFLFYDPESAMRALALFYDTGVAVERADGVNLYRVNDGQIHVIEKAIRKIPVELRKRITNLPPPNLAAVTWDKHKMLEIRIDATQGRAGHDTLFGVIKNGNTITLDGDRLDHFAEGNSYSDIRMTYLIDFRPQILLHEIGHIVDTILALSDEDLRSPFYTLKANRLSQDHDFAIISHDWPLAVWPFHPYRAMKDPRLFENERYVGNTGQKNDSEKFAEGFSQYILYPEGMKEPLYRWFHDSLFGEATYQGYGSCQNIVDTVGWWHSWFVKKLQN